VHDLAVIVVSTDQARWLARCLSTLREHAAGLDLDVLVVDNGSSGDVGELEGARVLRTANRGFAAANNAGLAEVAARWVLFLNPDTEVLEGSLAELVARLDARPEVGIAGVRQVDAQGELTPTMRRFPSGTRALGDALGLERVPGRPGWLGERELRLERYEHGLDGDWTIGSFLLARRSALDTVGGFDERFFLYSEEVDLCLRVRRAGWKVVHEPGMTILHHGSTGRVLDPRLASQNAWAQLQYAQKHLAAPSRGLLRSALLVRYGARSLHGDPQRRRAARAATALLLGRRPPPFERPARPAPPPVSGAEWERLVGSWRGPGVIGATGGSGTRVLARVVRRAGMHVGTDLNRSEDALDFAAFSDRWIDRFEQGEAPPDLTAELRALVARQHAEAGGAPWGWKEPRSLYLLGLLDEQLPGLRFLHVVRDGRDMALSSNQVQLRKHGDAVLGRDDEPEPLRSIALWREVNLRAADVGERLGERYLRLRFEDLCAEPAARVAEVLRFFGLDGDVERIAAEEVQTPGTLGRWRQADPELRQALTERAADALERFGYQSSSE
jgi:GT2 family glycosyltransferase